MAKRDPKAMPPFSLAVRVYYEDTDAGGVVYYANYLKYMERARSEWLRARDIDQVALARDDGVVFAVRAAAIDYLRPARLDDVVDVSVQVVEHGRASVVFAQNVSRAATVLCEGMVRIACLDATAFTPRPIPDRLYATITGD